MADVLVKIRQIYKDLNIINDIALDTKSRNGYLVESELMTIQDTLAEIHDILSNDVAKAIYADNQNRCVVCGSPIPEGQHICYKCVMYGGDVI